MRERFVAAALAASMVVTGCSKEPQARDSTSELPSNFELIGDSRISGGVRGHIDELIFEDELGRTLSCLEFASGVGYSVSCNWDEYNQEAAASATPSV